jgi:hypothetical protein
VITELVLIIYIWNFHFYKLHSSIYILNLLYFKFMWPQSFFLLFTYEICMFYNNFHLFTYEICYFLCIGDHRRGEWENRSGCSGICIFHVLSRFILIYTYKLQVNERVLLAAAAALAASATPTLRHMSAVEANKSGFLDLRFTYGIYILFNF